MGPNENDAVSGSAKTPLHKTSTMEILTGERGLNYTSYLIVNP